jgi:ribosomal protein S18 acetylase RimI-like enzyme
MTSTAIAVETSGRPSDRAPRQMPTAQRRNGTPRGIRIQEVAAADAERAVAAVALAFSADPAARWMYPEPQQYLSYWPEFVRTFGGKAFARGTASYAEGFAGAALWLPPGEHADDDALVALLQQSVAPRDQDVVFAVFEQMDAYHPSEPHWYLPLIGVDPARQGQGYGSALLTHTLARCDRERTPAYLESTSPGSRALYERHGFEVVGTVQAGTAPPIWPMVRRPR